MILRHEWMDVERSVYLNQRDTPKGGARTSLGLFEGDTLVSQSGVSGTASERHMCAAGLASKPRPSLGCLKWRPMMSANCS